MQELLQKRSRAEAAPDRQSSEVQPKQEPSAEMPEDSLAAPTASPAPQQQPSAAPVSLETKTSAPGTQTCSNTSMTVHVHLQVLTWSAGAMQLILSLRAYTTSSPNLLQHPCQPLDRSSLIAWAVL